MAEVERKIEVVFEVGGERRLKNIAEPVRVFFWKPDGTPHARPAERENPKPDAKTQDARMERRLTAILAADVVGYSRLMGEDEVGTLARLKT
jgi:class 3 adenylate cyclase